MAKTVVCQLFAVVLEACLMFTTWDHDGLRNCDFASGKASLSHLQQRIELLLAQACHGRGFAFLISGDYDCYSATVSSWYRFRYQIASRLCDVHGLADLFELAHTGKRRPALQQN